MGRTPATNKTIIRIWFLGWRLFNYLLDQVNFDDLFITGRHALLLFDNAYKGSRVSNNLVCYGDSGLLLFWALFLFFITLKVVICSKFIQWKLCLVSRSQFLHLIVQGLEIRLLEWNAHFPIHSRIKSRSKFASEIILEELLLAHCEEAPNDLVSEQISKIFLFFSRQKSNWSLLNLILIWFCGLWQGKLKLAIWQEKHSWIWECLDHDGIEEPWAIVFNYVAFTKASLCRPFD